jgi:hypothetical protein
MQQIDGDLGIDHWPLNDYYVVNCAVDSVDYVDVPQ